MQPAFLHFLQSQVWALETACVGSDPPVTLASCSNFLSFSFSSDVK